MGVEVFLKKIWTERQCWISRGSYIAKRVGSAECRSRRVIFTYVKGRQRDVRSLEGAESRN
jgi:hypothetical protein